MRKQPCVFSDRRWPRCDLTAVHRAQDRLYYCGSAAPNVVCQLLNKEYQTVWVHSLENAQRDSRRHLLAGPCLYNCGTWDRGAMIEDIRTLRDHLDVCSFSTCVFHHLFVQPLSHAFSRIPRCHLLRIPRCSSSWPAALACCGTCNSRWQL